MLDEFLARVEAFGNPAITGVKAVIVKSLRRACFQAAITRSRHRNCRPQLSHQNATFPSRCPQTEGRQIGLAMHY